LEAGHARAILSLPREQQLAAADTVIQQRLSVRQTEQLVRRYLSGTRKKKRKPAPRDADLRQLEEELSQRLAATVSLEHRGQGGRVVIEYNSLDELEGILGRLRK
jgi:ParB family chromosome partitioning protein